MDIQNINFVKIETFSPQEDVQSIIQSITDAGGGKVGNYDYVYTTSKVVGHWRPLEGSNPTIGMIGKIESKAEIKIEFICPIEIVKSVVLAIQNSHSYETPVINIIPMHSFHIEEK